MLLSNILNKCFKVRTAAFINSLSILGSIFRPGYFDFVCGYGESLFLAEDVNALW